MTAAEPGSRSTSPAQRKKMIKMRSKTTLQSEGKLLISDLDTPKGPLLRTDLATTGKKPTGSQPPPLSGKREPLLPEIVRNVVKRQMEGTAGSGDGDTVHFRSTHLAKDLFGTPRMYRSESITVPDREGATAGVLEDATQPHTTKSQCS